MNPLADCLFCKIIKGTIPSPKIFEDDSFICIADIRPQAKKHFLVIPKEHVATLEQADAGLAGRLMEAGVKVARQQGMLPDGFRAVINTNFHGGQTVFHLHLHILGGETLGGEFGR
jgi:histidine triad (HIT) family protein